MFIAMGEEDRLL